MLYTILHLPHPPYACVQTSLVKEDNNGKYVERNMIKI